MPSYSSMNRNTKSIILIIIAYISKIYHSKLQNHIISMATRMVLQKAADYIINRYRWDNNL